MRIWIGALTLFALFGCKQPVDNPEMLDPIYSDLVAQSGTAAGRVEAQKKKVEEAAAKVEKLGGRDPLIKPLIHEKENLERALLQLQQEAQYLEIRAGQRKLYDRESYALAFKEDRNWLPDGDFEAYKDAKKLRSASRDWEKRIPKDISHNRPLETGKKKKEEKKAE